MNWTFKDHVLALSQQSSRDMCEQMLAVVWWCSVAAGWRDSGDRMEEDDQISRG